jgi:hypothetical protein
MTKLYYTTPTQEQFDECKEKCIEIWRTFDDTYLYATEKINKIKDIKNVGDNFMYMVAMFDTQNQAKLRHLLSDETRQAIYERIKDCGMPEQFNMFRESED